MSRLSMNQLTTYRWSFDEDLYYYRQAGYEAIGLWRRKLSDFGVERGLELLEESGLAVSNLLWAGGFTGNDGRSLEQSIEDARQALHLAEAVGAPCLVVYTGGRNQHTWRHARRLIATALDRLLPVAEDLNVALALKPMHPACSSEWTFLTSLEQTSRLLEEFSSDALKLAYDAYHFPMISSIDAGHELELLAQLASEIAVVHLGDFQSDHNIDQCRCPLGVGRVPLEAILSTLFDAGYQGDLDIELMGPDIETADYAQLLIDSRMAIADLLPSVGGVAT